MEVKAKRGRGPGRPVLENLKNAGPLLREGEITRTHRVRASADVHTWFATMTAEERGVLLAQVMAGAPAGAEVGRRALQASEGPQRAAERLEDMPATAPVAADPHEHQAVQANGRSQAKTEPTPGLSKTLLSIVDSLKNGAVAELDRRERKWMVSAKSGAYPVYKRDLDKLVEAGLIQVKDGLYRAK